MEQRRFHRLYTDLAVEYGLVLEDQASRITNRAMIKNISQVGTYLEVDDPQGLIQGQVAQFTFKTLSGTENPAAFSLAAKGVIRRVDQPKAGDSHFGLAVEFLGGSLVLSNDQEAN